MAKVEEAGRKGAQVVCLPELYRSPYFCQREDPDLFDLAESIPGPSSEAMSAVARRAGVSVLVPVFERRAPGLYHNSVVVVDQDGEMRGTYRKMHIPDDPAFYEKYYFTPGDLGFRAFDVAAGRIGTLICWDQWYPEGARLTALQGAGVLFYPTAIGWHPHEKAAIRGAPSATPGRPSSAATPSPTGCTWRRSTGWGTSRGRPARPGSSSGERSFLCDPFGIVLAEASVDQEEILIGEVDLARIEEVRRNWPFLRDRRIDAYQGIDQRFLDRR